MSQRGRTTSVLARRQGVGENMRVSTLNIRHGGGNRVDAIVACLARSAAHVLILTEYRNNGSGSRLRQDLMQLGYTHQIHTSPAPSTNGLLVASMNPIRELPRVLTKEEHLHRLLAFQAGDVDILATYFPQKEHKYPVFEASIAWLLEKTAHPALFIGDLNTGRHRLDEEGATFVAAERLDHIESIGWFDTWRLHHADAREFSWFSNSGNGFRVDHAFGSPPIRSRISGAWYDQRPREEGATDHAMLNVDVDHAL